MYTSSVRLLFIISGTIKLLFNILYAEFILINFCSTQYHQCSVWKLRLTEPWFALTNSIVELLAKLAS